MPRNLWSTHCQPPDSKQGRGRSIRLRNRGVLAGSRARNGRGGSGLLLSERHFVGFLLAREGECVAGRDDRSPLHDRGFSGVFCLRCGCSRQIRSPALPVFRAQAKVRADRERFGGDQSQDEESAATGISIISGSPDRGNCGVAHPQHNGVDVPQGSMPGIAKSKEPQRFRPYASTAHAMP